MSVMDDCDDLGQYMELLAAREAHDARLAAEDEATPERLAALGATGDAEALLAAPCTACGRTGGDCGQRSYRDLYQLDGKAPEPLHPELRDLLGGLGLDVAPRCCLACSHGDLHGHQAHDRAIAQARAEHRTDGAAALAQILTRELDPSLAPARQHHLTEEQT